LLRGHLGLVPITHNPGGRLAEDAEPVQGALRTYFLDHPDPGVRDDDEAEQGILRVPGDQDDRTQHPNDGVEPGEDVRPDDLGHAAAGPAGRVVYLTTGDPLGDHGAGQAAALVATCHAAPSPVTLPLPPSRLPIRSGPPQEVAAPGAEAFPDL